MNLKPFLMVGLLSISGISHAEEVVLNLVSGLDEIPQVSTIQPTFSFARNAKKIVGVARWEEPGCWPKDDENQPKICEFYNYVSKPIEGLTLEKGKFFYKGTEIGSYSVFGRTRFNENAELFLADDGKNYSLKLRINFEK